MTFFVGWLVWSIIVWGRGQTPAKQVLGMTVIVEGERRIAGRGRMFFREVVAKLAIGLLPTFVVLATSRAGQPSPGIGLLSLGLSLAIYMWLLWDSYNQQLWDKLAGTLVVDDPFHQLERSRGRWTSSSGRPLEQLATRPAEPPLSAVTFNRAVEYFQAGKPDVALSLLQQGTQDAHRRRDTRALKRVLRLMTQAQGRVPSNLRWQADEIVRLARKGLEGR